MSSLLEQVIEDCRALSREEQDRAAEVLQVWLGVIEMPSARRMWLLAGFIGVGTGAALTFKGWTADLSGVVGVGFSVMLVGVTIIVALKLR